MGIRDWLLDRQIGKVVKDQRKKAERLLETIETDPVAREKYVVKCICDHYHNSMTLMGKTHKDAFLEQMTWRLNTIVFGTDALIEIPLWFDKGRPKAQLPDDDVIDIFREVGCYDDIRMAAIFIARIDRVTFALIMLKAWATIANSGEGWWKTLSIEARFNVIVIKKIIERGLGEVARDHAVKLIESDPGYPEGLTKKTLDEIKEK